jgi:D-tyrosyl-tRNA(Tyr) deacylase
MRAVIQRVSCACVKVDDDIIGQIGPGLLILLGIEDSDDGSDVAWLASKISKIRIFSDCDGKMNHDINDVKGGLLVVSQFTLHASTRKGTRPSFIKAARPDKAIPLYEDFVAECSKQIVERVETGKFGEMMSVELINDGPVTITIDTKNKE